ncbi:MAG: amidohydrolase family protein [Alcanivorax sp.]|nr:amidohydrolase family protein [Alcanivorax sp.]
MLKKGVWGVAALVLLLALVVLVTYRWLNPPPPAAQLFINGTIITMDSDHPQATAMLVRRGDIIALGDAKTLKAQASRDVRLIDLQGGVLMPGFIEANGHFPGEGLSAVAVDANSPPLGDLYSIEDLLSRLRMLAQKRPGGWLLAYGFDNTSVGEKRYPTREELDSISDSRPILVMHSSGHQGVANSAALRAMGITDRTADPQGGHYGHDAQGHLNGQLVASAFDPFREAALKFSALDGIQVLRKAAQIYLSRGITFAQNSRVTPAMIGNLRPALELGVVPLRLMLWPTAQAEQLRHRGRLPFPVSSRLYLGAVKLVSDGSIQGYTAFLNEPYYQLPDDYPENYVGFPATAEAKLADQVKTFHCQGRQVAIDANGDAAIDRALDAIAAARQACPAVTVQPVLVHALMATDQQLDRMAALHVIPSFGNAHVYYWGDRHRHVFLGPKRAGRISPLASAAARGLPFTLHADSPVVPFQPLQLAWNAVYRYTASGEQLGPDQAIGVQRALRALTLDVAKQLGVADQVGSLQPGKRADLVWLDRDPRQFLKAWNTIQVRGTWVGGVRRFPAGQLAN